MDLQYISDEDNLKRFYRSDSFTKLTSFVEDLSKSLRGVPYPHQYQECTHALGKMLQQIKYIALNTEPLPLHSGQRYGNPAFKIFHQKISDSTDELLSGLNHPDELSIYLLGSFGNKTRIDYGTGHELHFLAFLYCYFISGSTPSGKGVNELYTLASVFDEYVCLSRWIIERYQLEPAGSHGVWGLEDHHHIIFVLGASQLIDNPDRLSPMDSLDPSLVQKYSDKYIYFKCIESVMRIKKAASFNEHSPLLADIAHLSDWNLVYTGLLKMWQGEVLMKLPVMRHFPFCQTLNLKL